VGFRAASRTRHRTGVATLCRATMFVEDFAPINASRCEVNSNRCCLPAIEWDGLVVEPHIPALVLKIGGSARGSYVREVIRPMI
jgi:hypothetical protein